MVGGNNQNMAAGQITRSNSNTWNYVGGTQTINSYDNVSNKGQRLAPLPLLHPGTVNSCHSHARTSTFHAGNLNVNLG